MPNPFRKDPFGNFYGLKGLMISILGTLSFPRYHYLNKLKVEGYDILQNLPNTNVLFVANHQTYYADVIGMLHTFCAAKWKVQRTPTLPYYLMWPKNNVWYVAAEETMKQSGWLPKILALTGALTVKRTWRKSGENIDRPVDLNDTHKIDKALKAGWVITFPQGTTRPYAPGRKGTAFIVKNNQPLVVPIVIDGFRRAFDKRGLLLKKRNVILSIKILNPIAIDYQASPDAVLQHIMHAIQQTPAFAFQPPLATPISA